MPMQTNKPNTNANSYEDSIDFVKTRISTKLLRAVIGSRNCNDKYLVPAARVVSFIKQEINNSKRIEYLCSLPPHSPTEKTNIQHSSLGSQSKQNNAIFIHLIFCFYVTGILLIFCNKNPRSRLRIALLGHWVDVWCLEEFCWFGGLFILSVFFYSGRFVCCWHVLG